VSDAEHPIDHFKHAEIERSDIFDRAREVEARGGDRLRQLRMKSSAVVRSSDSPQRKYWQLIQITNDASAIVSPSTPCKQGCSFCCHIPVPISLSEALRLAAASGKKLDQGAGQSALLATEQLDDLQRFVGVPCPFLVANECSVYNDRPITCRAHHVIEADASKCDATKNEEPIASIDLSWLSFAAAEITVHEPYADIREFFHE